MVGSLILATVNCYAQRPRISGARGLAPNSASQPACHRRITEDERSRAHEAFVEKLGDALWTRAWKKRHGSYLKRRLSGLFGLTARQFVAIKCNEINVVQVQRREAAVTGHVTDDPAQEREQHARAFDHQEGVHLIFRAHLRRGTDRNIPSQAQTRTLPFPLALEVRFSLVDHFILVFCGRLRASRFHLNLKFQAVRRPIHLFAPGRSQRTCRG